MTDSVDFMLVNWSRGQFAMVAFYHWLFIPITIGTTYIIAIAQTIHVKTGNPEWERIARFWAKLFGINFAIGVGTGIILGLEFGTNWANYSWIAGDIFGAPLAAEGIMAFFLESTFIAVMFFGWGRVGKKFHLVSCWLVAFGASLSALWILTANAWMNLPVGMVFNPDTARHEMVDFWAVLLSPFAVNKFIHTITSCFVIGSFFIIAISSWYLLKQREVLLAKRSMVLASVFGLIGILMVVLTGDRSAYNAAQHQPAKLAAMEGLYDGREGAGLILFGLLNPAKLPGDGSRDFLVKLEVPKLLSLLSYNDINAFVPGINDLVYGNPRYGIISAGEKIELGKQALAALAAYKAAAANSDTGKMQEAKAEFDKNYRYMGYGHLTSPEGILPSIPFVFYSFRIMIILGSAFILVLLMIVVSAVSNRLENRRWLLWAGIWCLPLAFISSMAGWIVAEMGRQPWTIQGLLPTMVSASNINSTAVLLTFWMFAAVLTILVIAEYKIMVAAIRKGPDREKGGGHV